MNKRMFTRLVIATAVWLSACGVDEEAADEAHVSQKKEHADSHVMGSPLLGEPASGEDKAALSTEELYLYSESALWAVDSNSGSRFIVIDQRSTETATVVSASGFVYAIDTQIRSNVRSRTRFSKYDVSTPDYTPLTLDWDGVAAASGRYVYLIKGGTLHRFDSVTETTAPFSDYPDGWQGTESMAATGDSLFAVQDGTLWKVNLNSGSVQPFSAYPYDWLGSRVMAAGGGNLYAVQGDTLWRVNLSNGGVAPYSAYPNGWTETHAMTMSGGHLFAIQGGALWKVNTSNGGVVQIGAAIWGGASAMTAR